MMTNLLTVVAQMEEATPMDRKHVRVISMMTSWVYLIILFLLLIRPLLGVDFQQRPVHNTNSSITQKSQIVTCHAVLLTDFVHPMLFL